MRPPAVILAGGRSARMGGGDKCLLPLQGRPMLAHVLERLGDQAGPILINSNSDKVLFADFPLPVLPDAICGFQGPLAGLLTGMLWARQEHPSAAHILSVSCDTPFLPTNLVMRLAEDLRQADIAVAHDGTYVQPTIGLWPVDLAERLARDMDERGTRSIQIWLEGFRVRETIFPAAHFQNINTPQQLAAAAAQRGTVPAGA